jgi:hypothetical protein
MSKRQSGRSLFRTLKSWLSRIRNKPQPPDPDADRLAPVRRGPKGRSGAAVAEPEDYSFESIPLRKM